MTTSFKVIVAPDIFCRLSVWGPAPANEKIPENPCRSPPTSAFALSAIYCAANTEPSTTRRIAPIVLRVVFVIPNPQMTRYTPEPLMTKPVLPRLMFEPGKEVVGSIAAKTTLAPLASVGAVELPFK